MKKYLFFALGLATLLAGWLSQGLDIPFVRRMPGWAIGIYAGESPFALHPAEGVRNPVLTAAHVSDAPATFVADPFLARRDGTWYMFFEILNARSGHGDIACATSQDGLHWGYRQIVLDEPFHLSYPYVFSWNGEFYMLPESRAARSVRLYRAVDFPFRWNLQAVLLRGDYVDPSIVRYQDRWWLFAEANPQGNDTLALFHARDLEGPFEEHPLSPVVKGDPERSRPAGRIVVHNGRVVRYAMNADAKQSAGGNHVRAFEVTLLTPELFAEKPVQLQPVVQATGSGWNADRMHHVDPHPLEPGRWIASVDGCREITVLTAGGAVLYPTLLKAGLNHLAQLFRAGSEKSRERD